MSESVYIIHTREFVNARQNIYKIGRTSQPHTKRANSYPKGSALKAQFAVTNSREVEAQIIKHFKNLFVHRSDFGLEYFEGNFQNIMRKFMDIAYECENGFNEISDITYTDFMNNSKSVELEELPVAPVVPVVPVVPIVPIKSNIKYNKVCKICGHCFSTNQNLTSHLNRKKPCTPKIIEYKYQCDRCDKKFQTQQNLNTHLDRKFPCKIKTPDCQEFHELQLCFDKLQQDYNLCHSKMEFLEKENKQQKIKIKQFLKKEKDS